MELKIKVKDKESIDKVNERVSNIGIVHIVDGKIEEVIFALEVFIDLSQQLSLVVLIGDVPNHECGPVIFSSHYLFWV